MKEGFKKFAAILGLAQALDQDLVSYTKNKLDKLKVDEDAGLTTNVIRQQKNTPTSPEEIARRADEERVQGNP